MRFGILLLAFLFLTVIANAQTFEISGTIQDSTNAQPLTGATIAAENANGQLSGTAATADGSFSFQLPAGQYAFTVRFIGYREKKFQRTISAATHLGNIKLAPDITLLDAAEVVGEIQQMEVIGDTTQFNAGAFKTNPDATAQDLVEKLPGVTVTDGQVNAQGEKVTQVLIDGKPFMGNDPGAALKNLPAEVISRVQVYDAPSEQAEATGFNDGETRKTINIVTKEEFRNGVFGRLYGGYGTDNRYQAGGVINKFQEKRRINVLFQSNNVNQQNFATEDLSGVVGRATGGGGGRGGRGRGSRGGDAGDFLVNQQGGIAQTHAAGLNYNDFVGEKLEINGSYFFNYTDNQAVSDLYREYLTSENLFYRESSQSEVINMNHRLNLRLDYKLSERTSLRYRIEGSHQSNEGEGTVEANTTRGESILASTINKSNTSLQSTAFEHDLTLRHKFEKAGRSLSLRIEQEHAPTTAEGYLDAITINETTFVPDTLSQHSVLDGDNDGFSGRAYYSEPLSEKVQLQFSYRFNQSVSTSERETFLLDQGTQDFTISDSLLTSAISTRYETHAGGTGLRFNTGKLNGNISVDAQQTDFLSDQQYPSPLEVRYDFIAILPSARLTYKINKVKNLSTYYRSGTSAPSARQLQYVIDNSNPLNLYIGNPSLSVPYQHRANLRYTATDTISNAVFMALVSGNATTDYIGTSTTIATSDTLVDGIFLPEGGQLQRPENFSNAWSVNGFSTYGIPVDALRSKLNFTLAASLGRTPARLNGQMNYSYTPRVDGGIVLSSNISERLDFTISTNTGWNKSINSLQGSLNTAYLTQDSRVRLYWNFVKDFIYRTEFSHRYISGLETAANNFALWNMSIGTKLFAKKQGEINIAVFDLLGQNRAISRTITDSYIEDQHVLSLQRYFMVNFIWTFRKYSNNAVDNSTAPVSP